MTWWYCRAAPWATCAPRSSAPPASTARPPSRSRRGEQPTRTASTMYFSVEGSGKNHLSLKVIFFFAYRYCKHLILHVQICCLCCLYYLHFGIFWVCIWAIVAYPELVADFFKFSPPLIVIFSTIPTPLALSRYLLVLPHAFFYKCNSRSTFNFFLHLNTHYF